MRAARHAYRALLATGAMSVVALAAMVFVTGGWQAVAAFALLFFGFGFLVSFIALLAMSERPSARRPVAVSVPRAVPERAAEAESEQVREPLVSPRPVWSP